MANNSQQKLTLYRPAVYQIIVPGHLQGAWQNWAGDLVVENGCDHAGQPVTALTGKLDQAALIGLLRRLYSLGLPLISVIVLEDGIKI